MLVKITIQTILINNLIGEVQEHKFLQERLMCSHQAKAKNSTEDSELHADMQEVQRSHIRRLYILPSDTDTQNTALDTTH